MRNLILKISHIRKLFSKRWAVIFFDRLHPPTEGDTISIKTPKIELMAEFKRVEPSK